MKSLTVRFALFILVAGVTVFAIGCGQKATESSSADSSAQQTAGDAVDDHGGWWCSEHGVPEDQCSVCSAKAAGNFKAMGDWCEEHNRAESQCFECDPTRADKFAKRYEAKFGHVLPTVTQ